MSISTSTFESHFSIKIQGDFDFSVQSDFQQAYESVAKDSRFIIDFSTVEKLDSSALGMLLQIRDYAGGEDANIRLIGCSDEVKSVFELSNFRTLFNIS